jgi:hypothetical protein
MAPRRWPIVSASGGTVKALWRSVGPGGPAVESAAGDCRKNVYFGFRRHRPVQSKYLLAVDRDEDVLAKLGAFEQMAVEARLTPRKVLQYLADGRSFGLYLGGAAGEGSQCWAKEYAGHEINAEGRGETAEL